MKKTLSIIIHFICVLVLAAGTFNLTEYSRGEDGLAWLNDTDFENSTLFSEMVSEDISQLKEYAILADAFTDGGEGEVDPDKIIVSATSVNGGMTYTLSDLVELASRFGYFMDETTHVITYSAPRNESGNYDLRIIFKQYDPYYLEKQPYGPSQGVTDIKSLSLDALTKLSEYYSLNSLYGTEATNFNYKVHFTTENGEEIQIENNSRSTSEIQEFGRYLIVSSNGTIETNIDPQPEGILDNNYSYEFLYGVDDDNPLEVGVDTSYVFDDRYKHGEETLQSDKNTVRTWILAMAAALVTGIISLVLLIRGFDADERGQMSLDRIPLEAYIFICVAFAVIIYFIARYLLDNILTELFDQTQHLMMRMILRAVIAWICFLPIIGTMYRRSINGGLFKYSLASGIMTVLNENTAGNAAWEAAKGYVFFTVVNIGAAVFIVFSVARRALISSYTYPVAMYIIIILLIAFDVLVYVILYRRAVQKASIRKAIKNISEGSREDVHLDESGFTEDRREIAEELNNISEGLRSAVNEQVKADRLRTDLITNVSHDIRTPLTSIINYVDLMKRENVEDPKLKEYIEVLEQKSDRLKKLTEDLLEASKASSGNINLEMQCLDLGELTAQAGGELEDKFSARNLDLELTIPEEPIYVSADGRYLWRVFENLYSNAAKYSMEGTRVYVDVTREGEKAKYTIKNVSATRLNISPDELTERFVRGDQSRNTEGSGLGLSIAQSLVKLMNAKLVIEIDGDLYKASVIMDTCEPPALDEPEAGAQVREENPLDISGENSDVSTSVDARKDRSADARIEGDEGENTQSQSIATKNQSQ